MSSQHTRYRIPDIELEPLTNHVLPRCILRRSPFFSTKEDQRGGFHKCGSSLCIATGLDLWSANPEYKLIKKKKKRPKRDISLRF